ncbi:MAG: SDR family oxidoreductase, partial [Candidatus Aureabacteria bacterium]|nr:SDR family oxidoreductase [Candidatus Auribacterota bacterium]
MAGFKNIPVLITGAEGFLGSHLARRLVEEGARVTALVAPGAPLSRIADLRSRLRLSVVDVRDARAVGRAVKKAAPRFLFHLAAVTNPARSWDALDLALAVNLGGTVNVLKAAEKEGCESVLSTCTAGVYGRNPPPFREEMPLDPGSPYSVSKAAATFACQMAARSLKVPATVVRLFLVYGPDQGEERFLPQLIRAGLKRKPFRMTAGRQTREYTYIDDVVEGMLRAAGRRRAAGEVFNLGSGEEISLRDLARKVNRLLGGTLILDRKKIPYRKNEIFRFLGDHRKAKKVLGWQARV